MTLEDEMEKLRKVGYRDSEKDFNSLLSDMRLYEKTHDKTENGARQQFEWMFDVSCRQAEEINMELWVFLSEMYMIPGEGYLIKPPADLYNKKERQDWIKKEFRQYFYECMINCVYATKLNKLSEEVLDHRDGGKRTVKITKQRSAAKHQQIIEKEKELTASGILTPNNKRQHNTILAETLGFKYNFVADFRKLQRRNKNTKC